MKRKNTPIWKKMAKDKAGSLQMLRNPVTDKNKVLISQKGNFKVLTPVCTQNLSTLHRGLTMLLRLLW